MPKKTLLKVFAVLAVLAIAFASFTTLGGDDTVSGSAEDFQQSQVMQERLQQLHLQQVQHQQHCKHKTSLLEQEQKFYQLQLLQFITH